MAIKNLLITATLTAGLIMPASLLACDAMGKNTHVGNLVSVDAANSTFTIRDAQSRGPITFIANNEILEGLKQADGSIMVNYQEEGDTLTAIGVTF